MSIRIKKSDTVVQDIVALAVGILIIIYVSVLLGIAIIIGYGIYNNSRQRKKAIDHNALFNRRIYDDFESLGNTKEEREKNIKKFFEGNDKTIRFHWIWSHSESYRDNQGARRTDKSCYKKVSLARNLASMEPREREFLKNTFLLFNEGQITPQNYCYYLLAFVYGNGKGSIVDYDYLTHSSESGVKDGPSCVKYIVDHWDASVDSAVNHLLRRIEELSVENNTPRFLKEMKGRIHGGGAWFSTDEIHGSIFNGNGAYKLSLGHLDDGDTVLDYSGEGSLITIAPPGSGKTQCFVIPNLVNWQSSAVVLDIKGDIYSDTNKWREKNIGRVYKFNPLDPQNSNNYNPLDFVRDEPDYLWEDSRFLADMLIVPSNSNDPFWENMARDVLTAAIAYTSFINKPGERPMSGIIDLMYGIGWDEMVSSLKTNFKVAAMRQTGHSLGEMDKKQRDSILKTAQSSLSAWQGERISKVTRTSDWNPLDLRKESITIYICLEANAIDSYLSVLRVFIAQHIRMLTASLPERGTPPILFMLDELPRLKKMPPVDEALNIGRQYGIKLWMFAQSYGQLKEAYPNPEGILGSCVIRTFMNLPINDELTTKISDQLGYREGPLDASKQKLVEPLELAGPNYQDTILVLATNTKPVRLKKKFAYQDAELKAKLHSNLQHVTY